jgi:hypothetical protein
MLRSSSRSASWPAAITPPSRSSAAGLLGDRLQQRLDLRRGCRSADQASSTPAAPLDGSVARSAGSACSVARRPASSRGRTWRSAVRAVMRSTSLHAAQRLAQRLDAMRQQRPDGGVARRRRWRGRAPDA